ncbi:MAG: DeoR/GlpR family DNA-binding transcription regulator [Lachnospiraceae bacterium]|nr:DeoR/GlpR family DNA-binding transcription regulator [Lachnospiraceae bacterium]
MKKRSNQILELLAKQEKIEVAALSEQLGVSQVTIRKDLDNLEQKGIVKREHGFAILATTNDILGRLAYHYEEKTIIAQKAASLIHDGDTIMIESGSCCAILADTLTECKKNLTIITNSAFISDYIRRKSGCQIVLMGGIYQQDSQAIVGPMVRQCAENFYVNYFFIGVDGYSEQTGFTNQDQMRAQAVRDMATQADQVIVLTESEKFDRRGTTPMNLKDKIKMVITDEHISEETKEVLGRNHIEVVTA